MTETVKRFRADLCVQPIEVVSAADYDRLEQECERLRADMLFLAEYIAVESTGHPLPNYLAVGRFPVDVARAALSAKP